MKYFLPRCIYQPKAFENIEIDMEQLPPRIRRGQAGSNMVLVSDTES